MTLSEKGHVAVAASREKTPVKIYYELHGTGPEKLLLVQGLSTPCFAWERQVKYFAETGKYSVLIFDNRGMGHSDAPVGRYSTSQMAADAFELLDHFGWDKHVNLVGISMGGMISLEMATTQPDRFRSLTLTSTTARRNIPQWKAITALSKMIFIHKTPTERAREATALVFPKEWLDSESTNPDYSTNRDLVIAGMIERGKRSRLQPLHGNLGQTLACLTHNVSDKRLHMLKEHGLPILIVTGTYDNLVRPQYSHHMQKVLGARLEVFEGSGHGIPEEQADRYNRLLEEHFTHAAAA